MSVKGTPSSRALRVYSLGPIVCTAKHTVNRFVKNTSLSDSYMTALMVMTPGWPVGVRVQVGGVDVAAVMRGSSLDTQ